MEICTVGNSGKVMFGQGPLLFVLDGYQGLKVFHFMGTCGVNPVLLVMLTIDLDDSDGKSDVDGGDGDEWRWCRWWIW